MEKLKLFFMRVIQKKNSKRKLVIVSCVLAVLLISSAVFSNELSAVFQSEPEIMMIQEQTEEKQTESTEESTVEETKESEEQTEKTQTAETVDSQESSSEPIVQEDIQENPAKEAQVEQVVQEAQTNDTPVSNQESAVNQSAPATNTSTEIAAPEVIQDSVTISIRGTIESSQAFTLNPVTMDITEGDTVFDVLARVTRQNGIQMDSVNSGPMGVYIRGINNLFEFDKGGGSGWLYRVNGLFPDFSSSRFVLSDGDVIEWLYTEDLGRDVGAPQQ